MCVSWQQGLVQGSLGLADAAARRHAARHSSSMHAHRDAKRCACLHSRSRHGGRGVLRLRLLPSGKPGCSPVQGHPHQARQSEALAPAGSHRRLSLAAGADPFLSTRACRAAHSAPSPRGPGSAPTLGCRATGATTKCSCCPARRCARTRRALPPTLCRGSAAKHAELPSLSSRLQPRRSHEAGQQLTLPAGLGEAHLLDPGALSVPAAAPRQDRPAAHLPALRRSAMCWL